VKDLSGEAPHTEGELVRCAREGSDAAWVALAREHQAAVFRLAYLLLGDPHEAEDAAQEAFIRAYRALDRFDERRPLRPWLLGITANAARNRRRSAGRRLAALRRLAQGSLETVTRPDWEEGRAWEAETLRLALGRLGEADREVISLRYYMELSEAETAAALGAPLGTVKSRTHRALGRLRAVVESEFPELREEWRR
jgi:RNA polymerase sigma-70 factor (ECF subfamily)